MREWVDHLNEAASRFVYRAADAAMTSRLPRTRAAAIPRARSSNYERMQNVVASASTRMPRLMGFVSRWMERHEDLPVKVSHVELLSFGTGATVFLLHCPQPAGGDSAMVLKILRRSLGRRIHVLVRQAEEFRDRYEMVARWYADSSLIVPTTFVILRGPLLGLPAVACLQPLVSGELADFFEDHSDGQLINALRRHPALQAQFCNFVTRTLSIVREQSMCVDFVGRDNLLLVATRDGMRLQLIDFGVFHLHQLQMNSPALYSEAGDRLARLARLHAQLVATTGVTQPLTAGDR
ncbi:MAG TPA: hypothetical protein VFT96_03965 [Gemmatimonadaceae bacterium]|nr:hypothetical protein [Gemmatimonadaceae bacterium]